MRPQDAFDGSAHFRQAKQFDASCHGLYLRVRESGGVRAHAALLGPNRRVSLPPGEPRHFYPLVYNIFRFMVERLCHCAVVYLGSIV